MLWPFEELEIFQILSNSVTALSHYVFGKYEDNIHVGNIGTPHVYFFSRM